MSFSADMKPPTKYGTWHRRVSQYGFNEREAWECPLRMPLWMFRAERQEGIPFVQIIKREISCGVSCAQIAASFGVHKDTLGHWIRKWKKQGVL